MRASWTDPYLWLHLAGFAAVPILLELCLLGLAAGDPVLPVGLEFSLVAAIGIVPIVWMQWQRPFCIFCLLFLALKPSELSDQRRRLLRFFRTSVNQVLAIAIAVALTILLWKVYVLAPIAVSVTPFSSHWVGLGVAAIAFLGVNLFTQVPASVVRVLLVSDAQINAQEPYPAERVPLDFFLIGIRLKKILPDPPQRMAASNPSIPKPVVLTAESKDLAAQNLGLEAVTPSDSESATSGAEDFGAEDLGTEDSGAENSIIENLQADDLEIGSSGESLSEQAEESSSASALSEEEMLPDSLSSEKPSGDSPHAS